MKGLIKKEIYALGVYKRSFLLILAFGLLFTWTMNAGSFYLPIMCLVILLSNILTCFTTDEAAKWDRYVIAMPLSRLKIVLARYIVYFGMTILFMLIAFALDSAISLLKNSPIIIAEQLSACGGITLLALLLGALVIPICYKLGAEKARFVVTIVYILPFVALVLFTHRIEEFLLKANLSAQILTLLAILGVVVALAAYFLSAVISSKIYAKKEY